MIILRIAIILIGVGLLLPGLAGVFRAERLAAAVGLTAGSPEGVAAVRVLIGAPYFAMSALTILAVVRRQWAWLVPIAAIEGVMAVTRLMSGLADGFGTDSTAAFAQLITETVVCVVLTLGAILPTRSGGQNKNTK